jgi:hypothetical protein
MQLTIAMQAFNEKLRQMNQSNGKQLVLPAAEARNLQADIFALLAEFTSKPVEASAELTQVSMDGGGFRE